MNAHRWALVVAASLATGCVSTSEYDAAVKDAAAARAEVARVNRESSGRVLELLGKMATVQSELERTSLRALELQASVDAKDAQRARLQKELDVATSQQAQLRSELKRLGSDADKLLAEKGALSGELADARRRLDELRRAQAAVEARVQLYRSLALRLKKMVDAGELSIRLRDGRMVLELPNDVLFDTAQVKIKPRGAEALEQVAAVLSQLEDRHFVVAGHTDNVPIFSPRFASNWELSCGRGLEVTHFLIDHGVRPQALAAAGYGEFDPVDSNDSDIGRAHNRRIEIVLQPNVDEIVTIPDGR